MPGSSVPSSACDAPQRYLVWIVSRGDWQPAHAADVPPRAQAIELADDRPLSASQADAYITGFNHHAFETALTCWAIRVPVRSWTPSDIAPGEWIAAGARVAR